MRFDRYGRHERREATPQRVAAARRAVRREAEALPLFPELIRPELASVDARLAHTEAAAARTVAERRAWIASRWRLARHRLRHQLRPIQAAGVLRWWQAGITPGSPEFLLDAIHSAHIGRSCYWAHLANARRLALYREGRLATIPPIPD